MLLVLWSWYKDKQKQTFAPHLEGKELTVPKADNLQEIGLDYTAETLEVTEMGTEDMRDYSNVIMQTQGEPSPNSRTPQGRRNKSFDFNRRSRRTRSNTSTISHNKPSNDLPPNSVDLSDISRHGGASNDMDRSPTNAQSLPDDSIFRRAESKRPRGGPPTAVVRKRQTLKSKFCKLMEQRHIVYSTISKMSTISPRWKRVGLLFFLLNLDLFIMSTSYVGMAIERNGVSVFLLNVFIGWIVFALIARYSSVTKERLKDTVTTEDFQKALYSLSQESKMKNICLHFIIVAFCSIAFLQYGLFITNYESSYMSWVIVSVLAFVAQCLIDILWIIAMAKLYTKAYTSKTLRKMYRSINACRFWNV